MVILLVLLGLALGAILAGGWLSLYPASNLCR
jgi:hypothetical protein